MKKVIVETRIIISDDNNTIDKFISSENFTEVINEAIKDGEITNSTTDIIEYIRDYLHFQE